MAAKTYLALVILGIFATIVLFVVVLIGGSIYMFRTHVKAEVVAAPWRNRNLLSSATGSADSSRSWSSPRARTTATTCRRCIARGVTRAVSRFTRCACSSTTSAKAASSTGHSGLGAAHDAEWPGRGLCNSDFGDFNIRSNRITMDDLERHGLGLVLDGHNRNTRILVWSE